MTSIRKGDGKQNYHCPYDPKALILIILPSAQSYCTWILPRTILYSVFILIRLLNGVGSQFQHLFISAFSADNWHLSIHTFALPDCKKYGPLLLERPIIRILRIFKILAMYEAQKTLHYETSFKSWQTRAKYKSLRELPSGVLNYFLPLSRMTLACGYTNGDLALCNGRLTVQ